MLLLEIAAQGVKGVAPAGGRITLRPGYNVVDADGAVLRRLVESLLYPGPRDGDAIPRAAPGPAGPGGAPVRAGVTLVGNDQVTYRLVRDYGAGCQLHRFDPQKRAFALVSQDLPEIGAYLTSTAGVPPRGRLGALLAVAAADLPSKVGGVGLGPSSAAPARRAVTPEQAQKRLEDLRAELERARNAEKLQYRLDGLQSRLFKLEEALREGSRIHEGLESATAALGELGPVEEVAARLGDVDARIGAFSKAAGKRDEALARVQEEKAAVEELEGRGAPAPFWRHPIFLAAAGAGAVFFVVGLVGVAQGSGLRYAALLDIPAFGAAGWAAWRQIEVLEKTSRLGRRRKLVEERERKVLEQFERDTADVRQALQALGAQGVPELREHLGKLAAVQTSLGEFRERLAAWEAQPETKDARAEKERTEQELREVETGLSAEAGGYVRDPRSVEAEMARLEQEAAAPAEDPGETAPAPRPAEPLRGLLERAGAELSLAPAAVARGLQAKASQALAALSGLRLDGLAVDDRGNLMALVSGRPQPVLGLAPLDRDLCFLSLRLALLEQGLAGAKAVAFADDAFAGLPESARRIAARLLKQAARPGQLVHATRDPLFREAADHAS